jgi:hypothetical protein
MLRVLNKELGHRLLEEVGDVGDSSGTSEKIANTNSEDSTTTLLTKDAPTEAATSTPAEKLPEWKMALDESVRNAPSLNLIHDVPSLAKGYVNAQKLIGSDKIPMPSQHATADEWRDVYKKLGLPETIDDYKVEFSEDMATKAGDDALGFLKQTAYELNMMPSQYKGFVEAIYKAEMDAQEGQKTRHTNESKEAVEALKQEWGLAFEAKATVASNVLREFANDKDWEYLEKQGLTNSPEIARIMAKVGEKLYGEGAIRGDGDTQPGIYSPGEALGEIEKLQGDPAYLDGNHPNHNEAVKQMSRLYSMAYPV